MPPSTTGGMSTRWIHGVAVVLGVVAALALGVVIGTAAGEGGDSAATAAPGAVDVGFSRDMRDHHAQAVEMSVLVRDATRDRELRTLALDIMLTQQQQMGQMYGWLSSWGQPQTSTDAPMTWLSGSDTAGSADDGMAGMQHDSPNGPAEAVLMPGMATEAQLRQLDRASGRRAERLFLQLMIPHHEAGVDMARYAVERASEPYVRRLAQSIVNSQSSELDVLQSMLAARGGPLPIP